MSEPSIETFFAATVAIGSALGALPMNQHAGCWEVDVDGHWALAFNGHQSPSISSRGEVVAPFTCSVAFNGFPAGLISPAGGFIAAGSLANFEALIAAMNSRAAAVVLA